MSPPRRQVEELFHEASLAPRAQREALVHARAAGDPELLREVLELLATLDQPTTDILASPPLAQIGDPRLDPDSALPEQIGPFRIVGLLGSGGMGRVYQAEQESPRRHVALKVIRSGVISRSVLRRFEHEVRILASLEHPGIAQVFQAGSVASPDGAARPYFAMELVRGPVLTEFARRRRLEPPAILALLAELCRSVQHAHQRGVIHCDLKPGNILVSEDASQEGSTIPAPPGPPSPAFRPKILDFGIARLVDESAERTVTLSGHTGQVVGTLAYMAPEQLEGPDARLDTRCDIYALGVIGYELLAGRAPLELASRPLAEAARMIREAEPPRLGELHPRLRGDIETIIAKAMEKDRDRRYSSAAELAEDIRRFLASEPIAARPASVLYQLSKFTRRNRALVGGAIATLLAICAGAAASTVLAFREAQQRRLATASESEARAEAARAGLAAAAAELRAGNGASARARLAAIPESQRGWEWRYLHWLQDRSSAVFTVGVSTIPQVQAAADGDPVGWRVLFANTDNGPGGAWSFGSHQLQDLPALGHHRYTFAVSPLGAPLLLMPSGDRLSAIDRDGRELWSATGLCVSASPFSADGASIIALRLDTGRFAFLDPRTGLEQASMQGGLSPPMLFPDRTVLAFDGENSNRLESPSARLLASFPIREARIVRSGSLVVGRNGFDLLGFDVASGRQLFLIPDAARWGWTASNDGSFVVASDASGLIRTFDAESGQPLAMLHGHNSTVTHMLVGPDNRTLISRSEDFEIRIWDLFASPSPYIAPRLSDLSSGQAISPDGSLMVFTGWGLVQFADARQGGECGSLVVRAPDGPASASFSASSRTVAVAGWNQSLLAVAAPNPAGAPPTLLWRADLGARAGASCWFQSDRRILAACDDGALRIVDALSGAQLQQLKLAEEPLALALPDNPRERAFIASGQGRLWTLSGDPLRPEGPPLRGPLHPACAAVDPTTGDLAIATDDGVLVLLQPPKPSPRARTELHAAALTLAFSDDGARLVVGCDDSTIRLLDARSLREIISFASPAGPARAVRLTADALLASGRQFAVAAFETKPDPQLARQRLTVTRARRLVEPLLNKLRYSRSAAQAVDAIPDLDPELRAAARALALGRGDHLNRLNSDAWEQVRRPGRSPETLALALRDAEFCCAAAPDRGELHNTRGVALLRMGRFQDAISAIQESQRLIIDRFPDGHPVDAAALALCWRALGNAAEADKWSAALEALMQSPRFAQDPDSLAFLEESRASQSSDRPR